MNKVLIDTCVLINFRAGKATKKEKQIFVDLTEKYLCPQIILEFLKSE
jgi:predicted nucleic acid-binding protein